MLPRARFKVTPEDFVVDEIDAYPATGSGTHTLVRIKKRGLTTDAAMQRIARALGVDPRACGSAGLKDKEAVTTQRISLPDVDPAAALALDGTWDDLSVLEAVRHGNKLKPGHLRANRFTIRLRELDAAHVDAVANALSHIGANGCPNAFGPQRFGRDGDNASRALSFVRGDGRPPRDPRERRFLFSALQSRWFNRVLAWRVEDGTWAQPLEGDLLKKHDSGGMFLCEDEATDRPRALAFEVSPTGPIFGAKMPEPGPAIRARERQALVEDDIDDRHLQQHRALGEGTRRSLRLRIEQLTVERPEDAPRDLVVTMTLPKGAYATTVLGSVVELQEPARHREPEGGRPHQDDGDPQ
jgi:tRNA pseudouridine13 synthase